VGALDWTPIERKRLARASQDYCCERCGKIADLFASLDEASSGGGGGEEEVSDKAEDNGEKKNSNSKYADAIAQLHCHAPKSPLNTPKRGPANLADDDEDDLDNDDEDKDTGIMGSVRNTMDKLDLDGCANSSCGGGGGGGGNETNHDDDDKQHSKPVDDNHSDVSPMLPDPLSMKEIRQRVLNQGNNATDAAGANDTLTGSTEPSLSSTKSGDQQPTETKKIYRGAEEIVEEVAGGGGGGNVKRRKAPRAAAVVTGVPRRAPIVNVAEEGTDGLLVLAWVLGIAIALVLFRKACRIFGVEELSPL
jgi:hypothetical protein